MGEDKPQSKLREKRDAKKLTRGKRREAAAAPVNKKVISVEKKAIAPGKVATVTTFKNKVVKSKVGKK